MNRAKLLSGVTKRTAFCLILALAVLVSCTALGEGETVIEDISDQLLVSMPLPIDFTGGYAPQADGYKSETVYEDPTIRVSIEYKDASAYIHGYHGRDAGYWVVDIEIGDASQLRTASAFSFDSDSTKPIEAIADEVNAVVAFNGDYVTRLNEGLIIRQGKSFRDKLKGKRDVLMIDEDGDFHVFHLPKKGELSDTVDGKDVINAFYFGPILVENGEALKKMPDFQYLRPERNYARIAICQVASLHYKVILTTMEQDYTLGLQLKDFAQLCADEGVQTAYNLDGGLSTSLYFNHQRLNGQKKVNFRDIPDIFYFTSAWNGEAQE